MFFLWGTYRILNTKNFPCGKGWWWVKCIVRKTSDKYIHLEWSLFQDMLSMVCLMQYRKTIEIMHYVYSWMESSALDKQQILITVFNLQHLKGVDFSNLTPLKNEQKWSVVFYWCNFFYNYEHPLHVFSLLLNFYIINL